METVREPGFAGVKGNGKAQGNGISSSVEKQVASPFFLGESLGKVWDTHLIEHRIKLT